MDDSFPYFIQKKKALTFNANYHEISKLLRKDSKKRHLKSGLISMLSAKG